jgi:asparagine synthase (glutamine-hydrolysing)
MCGICGIVSTGSKPDLELVERMNAAMVHRGPDEGSVASFGPCLLGHRRLRVIDLRLGHQPALSEDGRIAAVLNGEIYNFRELRRELARLGHEIPGSGDTAVIPHLYERHGLGFVEHLQGMFAISIWDAARGRLVLARDRLGKKPLLYTRTADGSFAFASELKALLRHPGVSRRVDLRQLDAYLALQYVPSNGTGLEGVHKLPPGHLLVLEQGKERLVEYWRPEPAPIEGELAEEEWLELVRQTVAAAVRRRLISDVPLGALLSGGIDSSIVVALMAQAQEAPVRTFSVGFSEARYDERLYARAVAERYGTVHEELLLSPDISETLPRLAQAFDEPLGDEAALPAFLISEQARKQVTVVLSGDGGDESFAGYERYAACALAERLPGGRLAGAAARALRLAPSARREPRSTLARAARFLALAELDPGARYGAIMEVFPTEARAALWTPEAEQAIAAPATAASLLQAPADCDLAGLQKLDLTTYLPGDLLLKADISSMAHSLELRSPFLDSEVVELGLALPDRLKVQGRTCKIALRRAFARDLPAKISTRGKRGFGVPLASWFRGELRELARDVLLDRRARERGLFRPQEVERLIDEHVSGRRDHAHRLWCLVSLELWQRIHLDQAAVTGARAGAGVAG